MATMDENSTLDDLIAAFGGSLREFAEICGYEKSPAARGFEIKSRGILPVERWPAVIAAAKERKIRGVTPEFLLRIYTSATTAAAS